MDALTKKRAVLVAGVAASGALALGLVLATRAPSSPPPADLQTVSNHGTPATVTSAMHQTLDRARITDGTVELLGTTEGMAFYRIARPSLGTCYAIGQPGGDLGLLTCPPHEVGQGGPVLDESISAREAGGAPYFDQVEGWAADGVKAIRILDESGNRLRDVPVSNNTYFLGRDSMPRGATQLAAIDVRGNTVWTSQAQA